MKKILILFLLISSSIINAQQTKVDLDKLDAYFEKTAEEWKIPGMSVGIVKDGEIVFSKGYGLLEVNKPNKPDGNTLYAIASNSKAFTSAMIAMLVQEGKLNWNDKVQQYLPYFRLKNRDVSMEITIKDLLCHRSGLGTFSGDVIWYKSDLNSEEIIKRLKGIDPKYNFRDGYGYSNVMYITAGEIIKKVTEKSWGENVQGRILDPVKMNRTIYALKKLQEKGNYAIPHALENEENIPIPHVDWEEVGALGGIISSTTDMSKWMIFNMNHGIIGKDTLLTPASRNMLWKMHNTFTVDHTKPSETQTHFRGYGLGWSLSDYYGRLKVGHGGGYDGMISIVSMIPDEKLGVVVLTNGMKAPTTAVANYVLNAYLGLEEKDWSTELLERNNNRQSKDKRVSERKAKHVSGTIPSLSLEKYVGNYHADIYGNIEVKLENNILRMYFEHTPELSATLEHWHYDVWKINWDLTQAWFDFGTIQFKMTNNLKITGMDFDVPNNDIFFEELKPIRMN